MPRTTRLIPETVLSDIIQESHFLRGLSRHAAVKADDILRSAIGNGASVEIVFREAVYEHVRATYDWVAGRITIDSYHPCVTDDLPYGLAIVDHGDETVCCLIVYDNSRIAGILVNDTPAAVDWAIDVFELYRTAAAPVSELETKCQRLFGSPTLADHFERGHE